jgi:hypothetical protein
MSRAWFSGFSAVFLAHLVWFGVVAAAARVDGLMPLVMILLLAVLNVAGLAAFMIARQRSPHRLLLGLTMAPLTAALGTASNLLFRATGTRLDISGFYSDAGLFTSLLVYGLFVCVVGGLIGIWLAPRHGEEIPATAATPAPSVAMLPEISIPAAPSAAELPDIRSD